MQEMKLVWPSRQHLPSYVAALKRGWSPENVRGDVAAQEEMERIAANPDAFRASLVDKDGTGDPITLPDGRTVPRLPGYRRWLWDGEFCGSIGLRWQRGTEALPPYCLGTSATRSCLGSKGAATPRVRYTKCCEKRKPKAFVTSRSPLRRTTWLHSG